MPRIFVKDTIVHERSFSYQGKQQIVREQRAALDLGNDYALPFRVGLGTGPVYPVGTYDVHPDAFSLGKYGDLELSRFMKLTPYVAPAESRSKAAA